MNINEHLRQSRELSRQVQESEEMSLPENQALLAMITGIQAVALELSLLNEKVTQLVQVQARKQ